MLVSVRLQMSGFYAMLSGARGLRISFWDFAKVGLPVSLVTLAIAYLWVRVVVAL